MNSHEAEQTLFAEGKCHLVGSKTIILERPKVAGEAWHVSASSNHKVSICVIIVNAVPKSAKYLMAF